MLDDAMFAGDWGAYVVLRHRMIEIKEHVVEHKLKCGYECDCEPEPGWQHLAKAPL